MTDDAGPDRTRVPALIVFMVFLKLGLTSFGGPVAHLAYFREEFVSRRKWLTAEAYAELVALCQFLPGPASSQAGFAIGMRKAGFGGAMAAFAGFTLPSAMLMLGAAFALDAFRPEVLAPLLHGLKLVAAAVVAHAVIAMAQAHCRSLALAALALLALGLLLASPQPFATPVIIAASVVAGAIMGREGQQAGSPPADRDSLRPAIPLLLVFAGLLFGLPILHAAFDAPMLATADSFYRSGALVFGGGHAVLPMLAGETASTVSEQEFMSGYGAAQALPGPLFAFAGYLGALSSPHAPDIASGMLALAMIFLPGFLLVAATDRAWVSLRSQPSAGGAVSFASAAVVGVLAAAWIDPIAATAIIRPVDAVIACAGLVLLFLRRRPTLAVVIAITLAGALAHAVA